MEKFNSDISPFLVSPDDPTYKALEKIELNKFGTVIVTNGQKVVGTLSDGDIRKILLTNNMLSIPVRDVMNQNFTSILPGQEVEAKAIFQKAFFIRIIPIVDSDGMLLGLLKRD